MPHIFRNPGVYIRKTSIPVRTIAPGSTSTTALLGVFPAGRQFRPTLIRSTQECERIFGGLKQDNLATLVIQQFFQNGGTHAWIASVGRGRDRTANSILKGLSLLSHIDPFNILLIPETIFLPDREAARIFPAALSLIEKQRAIYLLDPPQHDAVRQTARTLLAWVKNQPGIRHRNVVLYHPQIQVPSSASKAETVLPPSGTMAGVISRMDNTHGVWKAPAGMEAALQGVTGLERAPNSNEINLLTSFNINPLRQISSKAYIAWGTRTMSADPEWRYVPVRRTALFLEASIVKGLEWAVFEPNDEPLWAQIRQTVGDFLHSLFRQGAFQGASLRDAYFVKCGRDTTTAVEQTAGIVNILVGFAPLKPAEFVIIKIQQKARPLPER